MESSSWLTILGLCTGLCLARTVYRLYFHPLSNFPGPTLAAISLLHEFYHDVIRGGMFIWEIERMHKKYGGYSSRPRYGSPSPLLLGPIVRINPRELHIKDSMYYDQIYVSGSRKRNKDPKFVTMFCSPYSMIATVDHEHHRFRRGLLSNFFSKQSVSDLTPVIEEKVLLLMQRFKDAYDEGRPVDLSAAFSALTSDIITYYSYGESMNFLQEKDFTNNVRDAIMETASMVHLNRFFPALVPLIRRIPPRFMAYIRPATAVVFTIQQGVAQQSAHALKNVTSGHSDTRAKRTMFDALSNQSIPPRERTLPRLQDEGMILLSGGAEPTANALTVAAFHLINERSILAKLRTELKRAVSVHGAKATLAQLEQLPYLSGVVNEALRLSYGIVIRPPRISPIEALTYQHYTIPPGTPVSMSSYFVHMDPAVFPDPETFNPDRWVEAANKGANLTKFMVSFGRGHRACIGVKFDMELYQTTSENIRVFRDQGLPYPERGHWKVKAKVTRAI